MTKDLTRHFRPLLPMGNGSQAVTEYFEEVSGGFVYRDAEPANNGNTGYVVSSSSTRFFQKDRLAIYQFNSDGVGSDTTNGAGNKDWIGYKQGSNYFDSTGAANSCLGWDDAAMTDPSATGRVRVTAMPSSSGTSVCSLSRRPVGCLEDCDVGTLNAGGDICPCSSSCGDTGLWQSFTATTQGTDDQLSMVCFEATLPTGGATATLTLFEGVGTSGTQLTPGQSICGASTGGVAQKFCVGLANTVSFTAGNDYTWALSGISSADMPNTCFGFDGGSDAYPGEGSLGPGFDWSFEVYSMDECGFRTPPESACP